MSQIASIREEVGAAVRAWQATATHVVILVLVIIGLPLIVCAVTGKLMVLPWPARWVAVSVYGALLVAVFLPRGYHRLRATTLLSCLYTLAPVQLALSGLVGQGRIALLVLPLLALILLGTSGGWIAFSISTLMLAAFTILADNGALARYQIIHENSLDPADWLFQALLLLAALIPLMILFTRFSALQSRLMAAERQAQRDLQHESATRRSLEGELLRAGDEERRRLGAELHDGLGQDLLVITSQAQLSLCQEENPPATATRLRDIAETAKQALEQTRRMAHNLRPGLLEELGFTKAVHAMLQKASHASGLSIDQNLAEVDGVLPPEFEVNLFRIIQEAINNILKHAGASQVKVTLAKETASMHLEVEDNGCGFELGELEAAPPDQRGLGLLVIAERAKMMGGRLDLWPRPGKGMRLAVTVPLRTS